MRLGGREEGYERTNQLTNEKTKEMKREPFTNLQIEPVEVDIFFQTYANGRVFHNRRSLGQRQQLKAHGRTEASVSSDCT